MDNEQMSQDGKVYPEKKYKTLVYTPGKNGTYIAMISEGGEPENIAHRQARDAINESAENIKKRVIAGELSPIAYYMAKYQYSLRRLANLTGLTKKDIRKHIKPADFAKIDSKTLEIYAQAFKTPAEQILKPF
ncbi:MAG TPA: hypothetical protein PKW80_00810 [Bacteroidales bacterium]|nr:hypothetical protein [Bacteroidales bacterium]